MKNDQKKRENRNKKKMKDKHVNLKKAVNGGQ